MVKRNELCQSLLNPIETLPGFEAQHRKRDFMFQAPDDFLSKPSYVFMQRPAVEDTHIFEHCTANFINETKFLRREGKKSLQVMDGYSCGIS